MYTKLFATMYDGTLATKGPWEALVTFQQLLVLADAKGIVDVTPEGIARRTTIPLEIIRVGIVALEQPDPESRSPAAEGRRIIRLSESRSWGWQIVNYASYRAIRDEDHRREYQRQWAREARARRKVNGASTTSTASRLVDSVDENRPKQKQKQRNTKTPATGLPEGFDISDRVRTWAQKHHHDRLEARFEHFIGYARAHAARYADWDQALMNAIRDNWAKLDPLQTAACAPSTRVAL